MKDFEESNDLVKEKMREYFEFMIWLLRKQKASVEALAEQEWTAMEAELMKKWEYTNNAVKIWEIKDVDYINEQRRETYNEIPVGVEWAYQDYSEDQMCVQEKIQRS